MDPTTMIVVARTGGRLRRLIARLSRWRGSRPLNLHAGHSGAVLSLAFSPDGRRFLSSALDGRLDLWDLASWQLVRTLPEHGGIVQSVAFSPSGRFAVSGSEDATTRFWDLRTGRSERVLTGHQHAVHFVGFDSSGEWALSGSVDETVKLWEFRTGRLLRSIGRPEELLEVIEVLGIDLPRSGPSRVQQVFAGHGCPGLMLAFSPDGQLVVDGAGRRTLELRGPHSETALATFTGEEKFTAVAFSPDGRNVLAGDERGCVHLLEIRRPRGDRRA